MSELTKKLAAGTSAIAMVFTAGCGGSAAVGGGENSEGPISIGVITPLTGASAPFGTELPIGAELAAQWIEEHGGVDGREIELHTIDSHGSPEQAVAGVRELIDDDVNIFIGTVTSPVALALGPVMEQTDSVLLTAAAHAQEITHENYNDHVFRVTDNPYMRHRAQAQLAAEVAPEIESWSFVGPDHAYGVSTMRSFASGLRDNYEDTTRAPAVLAPAGAADYRDAMGRVAGQNSEGVFSSLYASDGVTAMQQADQMGLFDDTFLMDSANEFYLARALGERTPDHWTAFMWYHGAYDNDMSNFIVDEYMGEYGIEPSGFVGEPFAAVMAIAAAVEAGGGSAATEDLIENLEGLEWDTPTGLRTLRAEDHQTIKDVNLVRLRGCADCDEGFEAVESRTIPGDDIIEEPAPGEPTVYGADTEI